MSEIEVSVRRVWDETDRLKGWSLAVPPELAAKYTRPGQVVVVKLPSGEDLYLAIASAVGGPHFDFLLGPSAAEKLPMEEGAAVTITEPAGKGYPYEMAAGRDVLIFAVGSAIAPLRPLIELIAKDRGSYRRVVVYIGAHDSGDFAYAMDYADWFEANIEIVRTVSKPWVQERFTQRPIPLDNAVAYVCGMKQMMEDVTKTLVDAGLPRERIGTNW